MLDSDLLFCRQFYMLEVVSSAVYIMNFQFCLPISVPRDFHSPHAREDGSKGENNTHTGSACASMSAYWRKVSLFRDSRRTSVLRREDRRDHYIQEKPMFQMIRAGRDYLCTHQYYWSFEYSGARQRCRGGRVGRQAGRQAGGRQASGRFYTEVGIRLKFHLSLTLSLLLYATLLHTTEKRKVTTRCAAAEGAIQWLRRSVSFDTSETEGNLGRVESNSQWLFGVFQGLK